jgi:SulP family sulfate permease
MRGYQRSWLRGDVVGGVTVAGYLVPQVMAYAAVAGLPPTTGLSAALPALVVYAVLGSSRQLSVGPESTTALMTAAAIGGVAAQDTERYAAAAAALAIAVGLLCLLGRLLRLGFVADLLSRPVLIGYLAGVAVLMILSQLGTLTGMVITAEEPAAQVWFVLTHLDQVNGPTLLLSVLVAGTLLAASGVRPHWPLPLMAMLLAAAATALLDLGEHGIATVGSIPAGLPVPQLPGVSPSVMLELALPALGVAVVGYTDNALTGRAFASLHGQHVDADQEMLALGAANLASGFSQGFPVSSSGSRTAIADALGVRTQAHSLVAVAAVVLTLVAFRPVLEAFPRAALAGVVVYAAVRLVDTEEIGRIARFRSSELLLTAATTAGVLLLGVLAGIGVAVALSILDLLRRVARAHDGILGFVPGLAGMHDVDDHADATTVEGLVVYRYDSPLFFANAEDFRSRCLEAVDSAPAPVEWLVVNMEANVEVDLTALDALEDLRADLDGRGVTVALARVKNDLQADLDRFGLTDLLGEGRIYPTLPTAVAGYAAAFTLRHGRPPAGLPSS